MEANQLVYDEVTKLYPSKRGLKNYSHFYENKNSNMVSCYPELAFHDNPKDAEFLLGHTKELAVALCKGVCGYYGVEYQAEVLEDVEMETNKLYRVQVGAFKGKENAERLLGEITEAGFVGFVV